MVCIESVDAAQIDIDDVLALYHSVGWHAFDHQPSKLAEALANSTLIARAVDGGKLVGLARVVSDKVSICFLQSLAVHPEQQRRGIGKALVEAVFEPFPLTVRALITGNSDGQRAFYASLGFIEPAATFPEPSQVFLRYY